MINKEPRTSSSYDKFMENRLPQPVKAKMGVGLNSKMLIAKVENRILYLYPLLRALLRAKQCF